MRSRRELFSLFPFSKYLSPTYGVQLSGRLSLLHNGPLGQERRVASRWDLRLPLDEAGLTFVSQGLCPAVCPRSLQSERLFAVESLFGYCQCGRMVLGVYNQCAHGASWTCGILSQGGTSRKWGCSESSSIVIRHTVLHRFRHHSTTRATTERLA